PRLLPLGGLTPPARAPSYGLLAAGGAAATRPFTFTASGTCGGALVATLQMEDGATDLGTVSFPFTLGALAPGGSGTFSNPAPITIPSSGSASPYPSSINVTGLTGTVLKVTATLRQFGHSFPDDVDVLLVGPGGQKVM